MSEIKKGNMTGFKAFNKDLYFNTMYLTKNDILKNWTLKDSIPIYIDKSSCQHDWKNLDLFTSIIKYCNKCDTTKE